MLEFGVLGFATFARFWPLDKAESAEHADPSRLIFKLCMLYNCRCTQKKGPTFSTPFFWLARGGRSCEA